MDLIDYDVDLDFMAEPLPILGTGVPTAVVNEGIKMQTNEMKPLSGRNSIDDSLVYQVPSLTDGRFSKIPNIDRSKKPLSGVMNNAVESPNAQIKNGQQTSDLNRISNQLNEDKADNSRMANELSNSSKIAASSDAIKKYPVSAGNNSPAVSTGKGVPPALDRSTKPIEVSKKILNNEADKLKMTADVEQIEREFQQLTEKKAAEAYVLADLMRKRKKIEAELSNLMQRHQAIAEG